MDFQNFYDQTFKAAFRFFYYKSVDFEAIEDLVQEVYLRFYTNFSDKLDDHVQSRKILLGICLNVYREWIRSVVASKHVEYVDEYEYEVEISSFEEYESDNFEKEIESRKQLLKGAIAKLNSVVRSVVELRFLKGFTRKEVAEKLNITEDQVHTYQKRGVKYLKEIIDKEYVNLSESESEKFISKVDLLEGSTHSPPLLETANMVKVYSNSYQLTTEITPDLRSTPRIGLK